MRPDDEKGLKTRAWDPLRQQTLAARPTSGGPGDADGTGAYVRSFVGTHDLCAALHRLPAAYPRYKLGYACNCVDPDAAAQPAPNAA
jgi:hypothetical protein